MIGGDWLIHSCQRRSCDATALHVYAELSYFKRTFKFPAGAFALIYLLSLTRQSRVSMAESRIFMHTGLIIMNWLMINFPQCPKLSNIISSIVSSGVPPSEHQTLNGTFRYHRRCLFTHRFGIALQSIRYCSDASSYHPFMQLVTEQHARQ